MAMIYAIGDVSGAHLNPAVTLGFCLARRLPARVVVPYVLSQLVGAFIASLALLLLFGNHASLGATNPAGPGWHSLWQSFGLEAILTGILMFVILCVSSGSKEVGTMAGIAIGGVIALEALFAGPICGASMNPARSLAPAVVSGKSARGVDLSCRTRSRFSGGGATLALNARVQTRVMWGTDEVARIMNAQVTFTPGQAPRRPGFFAVPRMIGSALRLTGVEGNRKSEIANLRFSISAETPTRASRNLRIFFQTRRLAAARSTGFVRRRICPKPFRSMAAELRTAASESSPRDHPIGAAMHSKDPRAEVPWPGDRRTSGRGCKLRPSARGRGLFRRERFLSEHRRRNRARRHAGCPP